MKSVRSVTRSPLALAALAMIAWAIASGGIWISAVDLLRLNRSYAQKREDRAFAGIPISRIEQRLDEMLPPEARVSLSEELRADKFLRQRLPDGLYPRIVSDGRQPKLALVEPASAAIPASRVVAPIGEKLLVLEGPFEDGSTPRRERFALAPLRYAIALLGMVGLGLAIALFPGFPLPLAIPFATLASAGITGLVYSVATWTQTPIKTATLPAVGLVLGAGSLIVLRRRAKLGELVGLGLDRSWSSIAVVLACGFSLLCLCLNPVWLWDGRSIWLFHARQVFLHGMFPWSDLRAFRWSQPHYPALFPAWLAQFSMFAGGFNERLAAMGSWPLFASLLVLLRHYLARALTDVRVLCILALFLGGAWTLAVNAYVDPVLALCILLLFLLLLEPADARWLLALIATLLAAQLKQEGLVFAALVLALHFVFPPRKSEPRKLRQFAPLLGLAPEIAHVIWQRTHGLDSDFDTVSIAAVLSSPARYQTVASAFFSMLFRFGYTHSNVFILAGTSGIGAAVYLLFRQPGRHPVAGRALACACLMAGFDAFLMVVAPGEQREFIIAALSRLMIAPCLLSIFALCLLWPRPDGEGAADTLDTASGLV